MKVNRTIDILFYIVFIATILTFVLTGVGLWMGIGEIEKQGGLGTSLGKFINSIQKEIE